MERGRKWSIRGRKIPLGVAIGLIVLLVSLVVLRLALPYLVKNFVNRKINQLPEYGGHVEKVRMHLWRGAYSVEGVNIVKKSGQVPVPFLVARKVNFSVEWRELLSGSIVSEIYVDGAALNFVKGPTAEQSQTKIDKSWTRVLEDLFPFKINRFEVRQSEVWFRDFHSNPTVDLYVTNLFAVATNLTNSRDLRTRLPAEVRAVGTTLGEGAFHMNLGIDPLAQAPTFNLDAEIQNMDLPALNDLLEAYAKVDVQSGKLDIFTEIAAENGSFHGYVKPIFRNLDLVNLKKDIKRPIKLAWKSLVAGAAALFKNRPADQVATKIPVSGKLDQPEIGIWATIANLLRNAFVTAFSAKLDETIDFGKVIRQKGEPTPQRSGRER